MVIFTDDAPHVAGTVITVTILAYVTYGMRVYTRITRRSWGIEDWLMTLAAFPFAVLSIASLVSSLNGVGIHQWRLNLPENAHYQIDGLFWFFLFEVFYCVTIVPIKLSIGFMLCRIAENKKGYIYGQYVIMGMCVIMNLIAAFYIIFQCTPVSAAWDPQEGYHCNAASVLADIYYATTAVNIFTDWATAIMPIPLLWNVRLNLNAKLSVGAILGLGIFASLSACIRLKYTVNLTNTDEYLFGLANIVLWGYAENGIGMFVGNLATLRPLFRKILRLGSDSDTAPSGVMASGLPTGSRHPYRSVDASYELGHLSVAREKKGGAASANMTQISTGFTKADRSSMSSDGGDSHKQMVDTPTTAVPPSQAGLPRGIMVSRQVDISHY